MVRHRQERLGNFGRVGQGVVWFGREHMARFGRDRIGSVGDTWHGRVTLGLAGKTGQGEAWCGMAWATWQGL